MKIFDLFRFNRRPIARRPRRAAQPRPRVLGAQFECLESRCLLSLAPPAASLIAAENAQFTNYFISALILNPSAAASGNVLAPIAGPNILPSLPSGDQHPGGSVPGQQIQLVPAADAPFGGLAILNGMTEIGGAMHANGFPLAADAIFNNQEARAVQDMLSSLRYVPSAPSEEHSQQPILALSAPSSAPSFPSSPPSSPSSAPSLSSPDALSQQPAQHAEGGMITLLRQPVAQVSTVDKISVAAIDALLEIPAKIDGVQGRFQAFEISVISEAPLPIAPPPPGAPISLPFEPANDKTPPAADSNLHGDWVPRNFNSTTSAMALSTAALLNTANLLAENALPLGEPPHAAIDQVFSELPPEAIDEAFSSSPRLDLATATILVALIGRALWPARAPKADEKTANSRDSYMRPVRLRLDRIVPG